MTYLYFLTQRAQVQIHQMRYLMICQLQIKGGLANECMRFNDYLHSDINYHLAGVHLQSLQVHWGSDLVGERISRPEC